jgi:hypothetical protein
MEELPMSSLAVLATVVSLSLGQSPVHEKLKDLQYFIGTWESKGTVPDWVKETPRKEFAGKPYVARISTRWAANKACQTIKFEATAGESTLATQQLRGLDAETGEIRHYAFDSDGASSTAVYSREGDDWVVKVSGTNSKGTRTSHTATFTLSDKDTFTIKMTDRKLGETDLPDWEVVYHRVRKKE